MFILFLHAPYEKLKKLILAVINNKIVPKMNHPSSVMANADGPREQNARRQSCGEDSLFTVMGRFYKDKVCTIAYEWGRGARTCR